MNSTAPLTAFLKDPVNSVSREALFAHRFMYDMTLAAACDSYALLSFTPTVDRDGVDLVLSDQDNLRPVQLKSTVIEVVPSTVVENIHGGLLKPTADTSGGLGFELSPTGTGQGGVVVLMQATVRPSSIIDVRYWFTDAYALTAFANGLVPDAPKNAKRDAEAVLVALASGRSTDRVSVPVSCFFQAANPAALLGLGGWFAPEPYRNHPWQNHVRERLRMLTRDEIEHAALAGVDAKVAQARMDKHREDLIAESLAVLTERTLRRKRGKN